MGRQGTLTTTRAVLPIDQCRVGSDTVVPNDNSVRLPFDPAVQILAVRQMVVQEFQQHIGLLLLEADDIPCELRVDIQRLLARGGMCANQRMNLLRPSVKLSLTLPR
jgi:hypothetical protein